MIPQLGDLSRRVDGVFAPGVIRNAEVEVLGWVWLSWQSLALVAHTMRLKIGAMTEYSWIGD